MGLGAAIRANGVPDTDFDAAALVEVVERAGETTTYMLRLPVTPRDGDLSWLADDRIAPGADLGVYVATDAGDVCLVRGPVTGQQIRIVHGGAGSQIEVNGADAAAALDRAFRTRVWEGARDSDAVSAIAGEAGFVADVQTTDAVHRSGVRALAQCDTDLRFLRRLARLNGYLAWLSTDAASGVHTLHFKPPPLDGPATLTLTINQDGATTDAIDVRVDGERPTSVDARQIDPLSAEDIDASGTASTLAALGSQPIGTVLSGTRSTRLVAPGDDAAELITGSPHLGTHFDGLAHVQSHGRVHGAHLIRRICALLLRYMASSAPFSSDTALIRSDTPSPHRLPSHRQRRNCLPMIAEDQPLAFARNTLP
jgi:hypothetical protein